MILYTDQLQRANSSDPIVDSTDVKGGLWTVDNVGELAQIPLGKIVEGMLAYVKSLDLYYQYKNNSWQKASFNSSGIPIYTETMYNNLVSKPQDYIMVRDPQPETKQENASYLDTMFQAIRSLQAEVAKLKNSFKYGINSYTETDTAMSATLESIPEEENEPLWALEEDALSEFMPATVFMDATHKLQDRREVEVDNELGLLTIKTEAYLDTKDFADVVDPKSIIFITSTGRDIELQLRTATQRELCIKLKDLQYSNVSLFNILIVISKKTKKSLEDTNLYGANYVWIQITDAKTNTVLTSGYYNNTDTLQYNVYQLSDIYYLNKIYFRDLTLSKVNSYTKAQDFSYDVIPSIPEEDEYKFGVAHLTIRSVSTQEVLDYVKEQLQSNELIWVESTRSLCIKSNGKIYNIGGNNNNNNTMTQAELIAALQSLGIIVTSVADNKYTLELADLTGVTFIHQDTNKKFEISVDSEGNLRSTPEVTNLLRDRIEAVKANYTNNTNKDRGFISKLRFAEDGGDVTKDAKLKSDRLKIGAIYAPIVGRTVYSCSHAYVELENTSDQDITLNGCYLYVSMPNDLGVYEIKSIALKGAIPAGGTFLIRGKQYTNYDDVNTVIKVKSFDQEWYVNGQLIDFQKSDLQFLLVYNAQVNLSTTYVNQILDEKGALSKLSVEEGVIDFAWVRNKLGGQGNQCKWFGVSDFIVNDALEASGKATTAATRDYILKNTFELDPAKQAFQAIHPSDSSRLRGVNKNDFKPFFIDKPIIEFPNSTPIYDVSLVTPKASFEHKNIATDKTKLNVEKPNMVYCSFGINMHTTRCFNWISVGSFDEFIWVREKDTTDWNKFESYKTLSAIKTQSTGNIVRKEFSSLAINNNVYARMQGRFPGDNSFYTSHKCIIVLPEVETKTTYEYVVGRANIQGNIDEAHTSEIQTFTLYPKNTLPKVYHITDQQGFYWLEYQTWAGAAKVLVDKIQADIENEGIMPVIINTGDVTQNGTRINEWLDYYLAGHDIFKQYEHMSTVGNNDLCGTNPAILGTGDDTGKSNGYYHHLFNCYEINTEDLIINGKYVPSTYYFECVIPKDVNTTKQVRFVNLNSEITFINCRDWFGLTVRDGETLVDDLAYNIYTGWTVSNTGTVENPHNYTTTFTPIYNTLFTWLTASNTECIVSCHEIPFTVMTRQNMSISETQPGYRTASRSVDGKAGGALVGSHLNQLTKVDNTAMYWFSRLLEHVGVKICLGGHKHTYTCTYPVREFYFWEDGNDSEGNPIIKNSLVDGPIAMGEDLSDEYANGKDKLNWTFTKASSTSLLTASTNATFAATTAETKEGFNCFIPNTEFNTSRLPIVKFSGKMRQVSYESSAYKVADYTDTFLNSNYLPIIGHSAMNDGVIYFMCQATGYKQTSNKELPGVSQGFSQLLPLTQYDSKKDKDTASQEQQAPMFGMLKWSSDNKTRQLQMCRIMGIQSGLKKPLYQDMYSSATPSLEYVNCESSSSDDTQKYLDERFGVWTNTEKNILSYEI